MPIRNLEKILRPRRIAVVSAAGRSSGPSQQVAATLLENLAAAGFAGDVYAVHPEPGRFQGVDTFATVAALPQPVDLALLCNPAGEIPQQVRQCGEAGIRGVLVTSAGFAESGATGRALQQELQRTAASFEGLRILGPRSIGIVVPHLRLNASLAGAMPREGRVAFASQSGTLCTSALDWAIQEDIGFSHFVSIGNALGVTVGDLIDYFAADARTDSIILFVESINEARHFMSAARAITRDKPIVVYKAGRFSAAAQAEGANAGAVAGVDAVYEAAFERAGIVRVTEIDDLFDCAQLLARSPRRTGPRLAIITNAGGPGMVATDSLIGCGGTLATLSETTLERLDGLLPSLWSRGNPVDLQGEAGPERFAAAIDVVLQDHGVDTLLVILTPQAATDPTGTAEVVARAARAAHKPFLAAWMGGKRVQEGAHLLQHAGVPTFATPKNAVHAFMHLIAYSRNKETLYETPRELPAEAALAPGEQRALARALEGGEGAPGEAVAKQFLEAYGIGTARPVLAASADEAVRLARQIGYPVAMKIVSPQIAHKNEVGGVALAINDDAATRQQFEQMMLHVQAKRPEATLHGVSIQPMITAPDSIEMILGSRTDPVFGPVIIVGAGGATAEILADFAVGLPPLNERLARRMLESLRCWPLLSGQRTRPPVDLDALTEAIIRFSHLVADYPQVIDFDVNPLLVSGRQVTALDARMRIDHEIGTSTHRRFAHLAIRPYPEDLVTTLALKDGTQMLLRPIKPEDEPLWHNMVADCSQESIRFRFRYLFRAMSHEMAARYCFVDYDREIAIVAEVQRDGVRELAGVGHLVCDADHRNAEYAVLVRDSWQRRGVGSTLTRYCLQVAENWGLQEVVGETDNNNARMIATFRRCGFEVSMGHSFDDPAIARRDMRCAPTVESARQQEAESEPG